MKKYKIPQKKPKRKLKPTKKFLQGNLFSVEEMENLSMVNNYEKFLRTK